MPSHIEELAKKACEELQCRLYLVEQDSKGFKVYADKKKGAVTLLDCEKIAQRLSLFFSSEKITPPHLEVSSPGLQRKLKYKHHFKEVQGKEIFVKTLKSYEGRRSFTGCLTQVTDEGIVIESFKMCRFSFDEILTAHLIFKFNKN